MVRPLRLLLCALCLLGGPALLPAQSTPRSSPTPPIFDPRPVGVIPPPTPTPRYSGRTEAEEEKPIERVWLFVGGGVVLLLGAGVLWFALGAWRSSNLFDRQYLFPESEAADLRLGGLKCGGHLAQVQFGKDAPRVPSKAKDA